jgi:hypothetical protein
LRPLFFRERICFLLKGFNSNLADDIYSTWLIGAWLYGISAIASSCAYNSTQTKCLSYFKFYIFHVPSIPQADVTTKMLDISTLVPTRPTNSTSA